MKKIYPLLYLILFIILLSACQNNGKTPKESNKILPSPMVREDKPYYKSIEIGKRARAPLYDTSAGKEKIAITVDEISNISMQFYPVTDFRGISINCPSFSNNKGSIRLSIYKWNQTYEKTIEEGPIKSQDFINFKDSSWLSFTFNEALKEDEYLLVIDHIDEIVGVWLYTEDFEGIRLYNRGVQIGGSIEAEIEYLNTPDIILGPLSPDYWWLDGDAKVPKEDLNKSFDVKPDSWHAIDGLGREMPTYKDVGDRKDKYVGMFYWTWHSPYASEIRVRNISNIMKEFPEAKNDYYHKVWQDESAIYFWDEPIYGYYTGSDKYVYRKHAELLADAGVDVVFFDATNGFELWLLQYETLCEVWLEAIKDGVKTPKIAFLLNFHDSIENRVYNVKQLERLYKLLYRPAKYQSLWFYWEGKPLIMSRYNGLDEENSLHKEILNFFTFRPCNPSYFTQAQEKDNWGWLSVYPQAKYGVDSKGNIEQICVGVAQNANNGGLTAMNGEGIYGRSYTRGYNLYTYKYKGETKTIDKDTENSMLYGLNFQQQWDYAIFNDPKFIWVTGWNERTVIRNESWAGVENAFVDQFDEEYSRDIEPSLGQLKDHYYYQLVMNIRKFKGVSKPDPVAAYKAIDINLGYNQWSGILPEFNHYTGNTPLRDTQGLSLDIYHENRTMRNDIVQAKVAYDDEYVYFMVKTLDKMSPQSDPAWMRLFIDTGESNEDWETFEYVVNRVNPTETHALLEKFTGSWLTEKVGDVDYTVKDKLLQIKIPREYLGFYDEGMPEFTFKWADNSQEDGNIMDFYLNGDIAPGGRFKFAFIKTEEVKANKKSPILAIVILVLLEFLIIAFIVIYIIKKKVKKS